jgi:hypothetical protein
MEAMEWNWIGDNAPERFELYRLPEAGTYPIGGF